MGWLIFVGIVLLLLLILMIPVHVIAEWDKELALRIRYLFLKFTVFPVKTDKKEKSRKEKSSKKEIRIIKKNKAI